MFTLTPRHNVNETQTQAWAQGGKETITDTMRDVQERTVFNVEPPGAFENRAARNGRLDGIFRDGLEPLSGNVGSLVALAGARVRDNHGGEGAHGCCGIRSQIVSRLVVSLWLLANRTGTHADLVGGDEQHGTILRLDDGSTRETHSPLRAEVGACERTGSLATSASALACAMARVRATGFASARFPPIGNNTHEDTRTNTRVRLRTDSFLVNVRGKCVEDEVWAEAPQHRCAELGRRTKNDRQRRHDENVATQLNLGALPARGSSGLVGRALAEPPRCLDTSANDEFVTARAVR
jgi:hypothetical protein